MIDEQTIIDAYELHPTAVIREVEAVAQDLKSGLIRSAWAILAKRCERIIAPPSNPTMKTGLDKEKAIAHAEQWVRATGIHYDRDTEIQEELFGDRGLLRAYTQITLEETSRNTEGHPIYAPTQPTGDLALIEQMTKLWEQHRPAGIAIEQDAEHRAAKWKHEQTQIVALKRQVIAELDNKQTQRKPLPDADYSAIETDDHPPV